MEAVWVDGGYEFPFAKPYDLQKVTFDHQGELNPFTVYTQTERTFHDSVRVSLGQLATDYGLQLEPVDEGSFKLPLKGFEIKIYLGFGHLADVNTLIVPTDDPPKQRNIPGSGLLNFVEYQNPNVSFIDLRLMNPEELPQKLEVLSRLLREYCDSFLRGDFSIWPKIVAFVEAKISRREKGIPQKTSV